MTVTTSDQLITQGNDLVAQGDLAAAEKVLSGVSETDENYADACLLLGSIYVETLRIDEALRYITKAVELDPDNITGYLALAHIYQSMGQLSRALATLETAIDRDDTNAEAHCALGKIMVMMSQTQRALFHLKRATELNPSYLLAWMLIASLCQHSGKLKMAAEAWRMVLAIDQDSQDAVRGLARFLLETGVLDEAEALLHSALERHPDLAIYHSLLGDVLVRKGEHALALEQACIALEAEPDNPDFIFGVAEIHARHGNVDMAFDLLQPFLEARDVPYRPVMIFAHICDVLGMKDEGVFLIDKVLGGRLTPAKVNALRNLRSWLVDNRN